MRGETIIALRARRQALRFAGEVAYPHLEVTPPPMLFVRRDEAEEVYYEPTVVYAEPPPFVPAPWWIKWFAIGCLIVIGATFLCMIKMT